jgi:hypothetical protein
LKVVPAQKFHMANPPVEVETKVSIDGIAIISLSGVPELIDINQLLLETLLSLTTKR